MKKETISSGSMSEFSQIMSMLKHMGFEQVFSLNNDFSRRHLCPNPPALAGGRLKKELEKEGYTHETI